MVAHSDEKIEEQLAALFHLSLHGATSLESVSTSDDECKVVSTKLRVGVGCVGICESGRGKDGGDLYTRLEALLSKGKTLQLVEAIAICCTAVIC